MNKFLTNVKLNIEPLIFDIKNSTDRTYKHYKLELDAVNPEMISFLKSLGIGILMVEVFFTPPFLKRGIHIDTAHGGDITKLNWIYCQGENIMNWYKTKEGVQRIVKATPVSTSFVSYEANEVELIHTEKIINSNVIVQVGIPHNVQNLKYPRWATCFTICKLQDRSRITVEEAHLLFKDYIF
jgi:hypothetical protein